MTTAITMRKSEVGELRPSQVLHTFGIGSIVDGPNLSVLVMGMEDWPIAHSNEIGEERLLASVQNILGPQVTRLLTPPRAEETLGSQSNWFDDFHTIGVPVAPFPRWMVCTACRLLAPLISGLFEPRTFPYPLPTLQPMLRVKPHDVEDIADQEAVDPPVSFLGDLELPRPFLRLRIP